MMIKVTELRIGNWIKDDDGDLSKVIGFKPFDDSIRCDETDGCEIMIDIYESDGTERKGYMCESCDVKPLPLTVEILVKCGFVQEYNEFYKLVFANHNGYLSKAVKNIYVEVCTQNLNAFEAPCKYLHQLQNLYFALTGEELNYKL